MVWSPSGWTPQSLRDRLVTRGGLVTRGEHNRDGGRPTVTAVRSTILVQTTHQLTSHTVERFIDMNAYLRSAQINHAILLWDTCTLACSNHRFANLTARCACIETASIKEH